MAKNFHNGTNIVAKHDPIFLGEEILEFFMAGIQAERYINRSFQTYG
jgi:hypothetical protein